jgi:hypothetical protein
MQCTIAAQSAEISSLHALHRFSSTMQFPFQSTQPEPAPARSQEHSKPAASTNHVESINSCIGPPVAAKKAPDETKPSPAEVMWNPVFSIEGSLYQGNATSDASVSSSSASVPTSSGCGSSSFCTNAEAHACDPVLPDELSDTSNSAAAPPRKALSECSPYQPLPATSASSNELMPGEGPPSAASFPLMPAGHSYATTSATDAINALNAAESTAADDSLQLIELLKAPDTHVVQAVRSEISATESATITDSCSKSTALSTGEALSVQTQEKRSGELCANFQHESRLLPALQLLRETVQGAQKMFVPVDAAVQGAQKMFVPVEAAQKASKELPLLLKLETDELMRTSAASDTVPQDTSSLSVQGCSNDSQRDLQLIVVTCIWSAVLKCIWMAGVVTGLACCATGWLKACHVDASDALEGSVAPTAEGICGYLDAHIDPHGTVGFPETPDKTLNLEKIAKAQGGLSNLTCQFT